MIDRFINTYLPFVFDWIIDTSLMASVLVGFILCVKVLLRNKLGPRWHYLLWMILIVRLLLPWSPDSSYSMYSLLSYGYKTTTFAQNQPVVSSKNEHVRETKSMPDINTVKQETSSNDHTHQTTKEPIVEPAHNEKQKDTALSLYTIVSYIWMIGVIILGFTTYLINRRLHSYIQQQPVITEERVINIFEKCKRSMSIQNNIPLLIAGKVSSPTVFGFFHPKVLISSVHISRLNEQQLQHIFHHELGHIKRRDVFVNWIMYSLLILNWFNPILWYAYSCMREDQEMACDALALTFFEEKEKIAYGYTIINLLEHSSSYYQVPGLANLIRNKRALKRRVFMIKKFQKKSYRWSVLGVITVIVVSLFSLLNARADGTTEQQKGQTSKKETTTEIKKEGTVYTPPKQEEYFGDMTKEEILTKMLNTVDNFETAKGEFKVHQATVPGDGVINYELSLHNKAGGHSKTTRVDNEIEKVTSLYYNDGIMWKVVEDTGMYIELKYPEEERSKPLKIENAFLINSEGDNVTVNRERPPIGEAMSSLFPYEIASNYTRNLNTWEIEKQNEQLLGHNTLVIKGNINKRINKSFRFWVDKDTGILVKYETYDAAGKVADYLYSTSLEINVPIDSKRFTPDLTGYKKEEMFKKDQPQMKTGNIDSLVPEAIKAQWEEAKKKPNETATLKYNDKWYIHAKKGYLVNNIEVNGKEGTLFLAKASPQKEHSTFSALAEGYKVETLKIVYE
ncbi:M56 family metallopeptidase [Bacillus cereus group sp. BfR-BA-01380]|uniref:M56 family metallopeptidase n=1 Tax=Bacillus cereus group sp. BfR-BA-01380 TaxID=2920324 RepID=UPI001F58B1DB|nr:M56 family metallopeptidase [Bacillus cereus group sp. BfR-BA-01380]